MANNKIHQWRGFQSNALNIRVTINPSWWGPSSIWRLHCIEEIMLVLEKPFFCWLAFHSHSYHWPTSFSPVPLLSVLSILWSSVMKRQNYYKTTEHIYISKMPKYIYMLSSNGRDIVILCLFYCFIEYMLLVLVMLISKWTALNKMMNC